MSHLYREVTGDVLNLAFHNFRDAHSDDIVYVAIVRNFKRIFQNDSFLSHTYCMPMDRADLLEAFAGPHGLAMVKAYLARRGKNE